MSLVREYQYEVSAKVLIGTQENYLAITIFVNKGFFPKKQHRKTVEANDPSLSNDLFGICKDMWD